MKDETFGPVIAVMKVHSDEEAISLMNDSEFGLTASLWTSNKDGKAEELADLLEAGTVFSNRYPQSLPLRFIPPFAYPPFPLWIDYIPAFPLRIDYITPLCTLRVGGSGC